MTHNAVTKEDIEQVRSRLAELKPLPEVEARRCEFCAMFMENECHRFPPMANWPRVQKSDWCGEWRKK